MPYNPNKPHSVSDALTEIEPIVKSKKLVIFAGSGVSVDPPSNLPTWDGLMSEFIKFCREDIAPHVPQQSDFINLLNDADATKAEYPTRVATTLKNHLKNISKTTTYNLDQIFERWLIGIFSGKQHNENHELIVKSNYQYILTSNYDDLLEVAAKKLKLSDLHLHSYTYQDVQNVASVFYEGQPSIIHIHGIFNQIPLDEIVFTSDDYVKIKRKYSGFRSSLLSLFSYYSVLFVGYGGSDPHLEDFIEEIAYQLDWSTISGLPRYFLALPQDKVNSVLSQYKASLRTEIIALRDFSEMTDLLKGIYSIAPR